MAAAERLNVPDYHPVLDLTETDTRRESIRTAIDDLAHFVREAADATPAADPLDTATEDPVLAAVTQLYEGRVGLPMSASETRTAEKEALERYDRCVPPGYKDAEKEAPRRYNDYFIWKQLLANAGEREPRRPCIFVTNDRKEDWWRRRRELLVGPRTELVREYFDATGEAFWMYTPEVFLQHAQRFRIEDLPTTTIDAVRTASEAATVARVLRSQRMVLPDVAARLSALERFYEDVSAVAATRRW